MTRQEQKIIEQKLMEIIRILLEKINISPNV